MPNPTGPGACEHCGDPFNTPRGDGTWMPHFAEECRDALRAQLVAARAEAAEAVAKARREALEEAAGICDAYVEEIHDYDSNLDAARLLAQRISGLASTPAAAPPPHDSR